MDVVRRQHAVDDFHAELGTNLTADVTYTLLDIALQNLEAVFGRPHEVRSMVKNAVFSCVILHVLILPKMNLCPNRAVHFWEDKNITDSSR